MHFARRRTVASLALAAALATPALAAPALAEPASPGAVVDDQGAQQGLSFTYLSHKAVSDPNYGPVLAVDYTVKNTGGVPGPWEFHMLSADGKNFIDDEGEEMYSSCDLAVSSLKPGMSTTCHSLIRVTPSEVAAGTSTPVPVTFQWGNDGPKFAGFTVPATSVAHLKTSEQPTEQNRRLEFSYLKHSAKNDPDYGPVLDIDFTVKNTGDVRGPWEFHMLSADGKNFIDDEGEEMYVGCQLAISMLKPGQSTTCNTQVRLTDAELKAGMSKAVPTTFQWESDGPKFDGFTVPATDLSSLKTTAPDDDSSTGAASEPAKPAKPSGSSQAPSAAAPSASGERPGTDAPAAATGPTGGSSDSTSQPPSKTPSAKSAVGPRVETDRVEAPGLATGAWVGLGAGVIAAVAGLGARMRRSRA